ncbi:SPX domain-containing protein [Salvia divinorum]|uniref:SPX domain-containing protein n=1 Tax=Salvia divinorum TaxID=28513 RepID=A0ABD1HL59_SALDI
MKFGREFRIHLEQTLPEWRDKFLRYKLLKKLLNSIAPAAGFLPLAFRCRSFRPGLWRFLPRKLKSSTISTSVRRRISSSVSRPSRRQLSACRREIIHCLPQRLDLRL